jgi:hypothetical protein
MLQVTQRDMFTTLAGLAVIKWTISLSVVTVTVYHATEIIFLYEIYDGQSSELCI